MIHFAKLSSSPRLRLLLDVLTDGKQHTTRDIFDRTGSMAVHTDISELRANGYTIVTDCQGRNEHGRTVYSYQWRPRSAQMEMCI